MSGITGLWRMDYLEESFAKSGFKAGNAHHLNTLPAFGALQTHILHQSAYNLVYEAVRKKDNSPWFCGDGDAYNLNETFLSACEEKLKQYSNRGSRSYGVRDEYRLDHFNSSEGVLWIPTQVWFNFALAHLKAVEISTMHVY
ncbi:hypothetical protein CPB84DRAFT_1744121 [Gymnopilus junonius]|uniref:Uncharacterized protein n=1 Tax=Gymnopilus junonius TaxID=109634 RepID=A0A9P5TRP5_GYMJU|nr:hypothetical protein CPB84DRAFT_1744121 [Gymnopilus junonius]